ncbi:MAG: Ferric enterobactin transport ATP-binding protein FepC [Herbaspirillum frisingense]|uniref:Ferric enterobactin transport ATP-binding protein FepC n=1 Tax=Herbaspirillum frisingense TaxID=92645 RepID=A0A7V8JUK2_9BURK|nr:MAG: Ferric enterobactin transport ATP-binding protein FepC [Herbaspirillum frisingense]
MSAADRIVFEVRRLDLHVSGRALLEGLDWQIRAGEFWCVLGRNGIGKSSLLHAAAGLLRPHGGALLLDGEALASLSPAQMAVRRGLLLQHQHDAFSMPVLDAVIAGRFVRGGGWSEEAEDRRAALAALDRVGLASLAGADILRLSGGERQRVAVATLLAQDPGLYLLDEPTSHQDIAAQLHLMQLLRELAAQGKAVAASCHDINLAQRFATHILLLGDDRRWSGPTTAVMQAEPLGAAFGCRFHRVGEGTSAVFVSELG